MQKEVILVERLPVLPNGKHAGLDAVPRSVRDQGELQEWLEHQ
jgi:hypothetical protein